MRKKPKYEIHIAGTEPRPEPPLLSWIAILLALVFSASMMALIYETHRCNDTVFKIELDLFGTPTRCYNESKCEEYKVHLKECQADWRLQVLRNKILRKLNLNLRSQQMIMAD